jgi:hypothetical protein
MTTKRLSFAIATELVESASVSDRYAKAAQAATLRCVGAIPEMEKEIARKLVGQITVENVPFIVNALLQPKRLNELQALVLRLSWSGRTYEEIAAASGYSTQHIRDVGYRLWQLLSKVLGEKISKSNVRSVLGQVLTDGRSLTALT